MTTEQTDDTHASVRRRRVRMTAFIMGAVAFAFYAGFIIASYLRGGVV